MDKKLTQFERILKEKLADYEAPYDAKSWYNIDKQMNVSAKSNSPWIVAVVATLLVSTAVGTSLHKYHYSPSEALLTNIVSNRFNQISVDNIHSVRLESADISADGELIDTPEITRHFTIPQDAPFSEIILENLSSGSITPEEQTSSDNVSREGSKALAFESDVREGCAGSEINFKATNGPTSGSYLWNFGDGRFSNEPNPKHKFTKPGKYDVSLSVTSNDGQIRTVVSNDLITIFPSPRADFKWGFVNESPENISVELINSSDNATKYEWRFEDGKTSGDLSPVKVLQDGQHPVLLVVINDFGCSDELTKLISINSNSNLGAASSFQPSKELYMPSGLKNKDAHFELAIYDMNNELIYRTSQYSKGWDGRMRDSSYAKAGEYKWKVVLTDSKAEQKYFNGVFTVFP